MSNRFVDSVVTTADPPPSGVPNPIHATDGADAAGYAGALVAGVRTYGWLVDTVLKALGENWLNNGWIDYSLRRPLYAGEVLEIVVEHVDGTWLITCSAGDEKRTVLDGTAGLGNAPWLGELEPPKSTAPLDKRESLPGYDLDNVPIRQPLNPLKVYVSSDTAKKMVAEDLGLNTARYLDSKTPAPIHPYFLAGRIAPLTRHNFVYGPTIHVRSQIQHRREALADQEITVGAQIVDAYEKKDNWYQVLDGTVTDSAGEIALIRHHTIFRPRGT
ncbi:MAG: hypothetical protein VB957_19270 [Pseudomonadales bacterium]|jgi:hypothetical protein